MYGQHLSCLRLPTEQEELVKESGVRVASLNNLIMQMRKVGSDDSRTLISRA